MINPFWGNIFETEADPSQIKTEKFLLQIPLFSKLTKKEARKVAQIVHERHYQEGEIMFEMGHPGAAMFIIKTGLIKIVIPNAKADGTDLELALLKSGSFLGELALLDDSPRSASAVIGETAVAYAFFRTDLDRLIDSDPTIGSKILKELAMIIGQRLKHTNEQLFAKQKS